MKILFFEMKKCWLKLPILVVLILFLALNSWRICDMYKLSGFWTRDDMQNIKQAYFSIYEDILSGEITSNKIEYAKENYCRLSDEMAAGNFSTEYDESRLAGYFMSDYLLFSSFIVPELEYAVTYTNVSNKIAARAYDNISFYSGKDNKKELAKNSLIYKLYSDRSIDNYYLTEWAEIYFRYEFSCLLILIMIILGISAAFSGEYESGMFMLIRAEGQTGRTVNAKLISAAVYVFALVIIFLLSDLITISFLSPIDGMNAPIYSAELFKLSPLNGSFSEVIIACGALRFSVFLVIAEIIMLISVITKNTIASVVVSFSLITALIIASDGSRTILNPVNMLSSYNLISSFDCVYVSGHAVLSFHAAIIFYLVTVLILAVFIKLFTSESERRNKNVQA